MLLFEQVLLRLPALANRSRKELEEILPVLFSQNLLRTWINHLAAKDRNLHKVSLKIVGRCSRRRLPGNRKCKNADSDSLSFFDFSAVLALGYNALDYRQGASLTSGADPPKWLPLIAGWYPVR